MARFRIAHPAQADLAHVLATSGERWGPTRRRRYGALLVAAMRLVAAVPDGPLTRARADLGSGMRSFHVRHARRAVSADVSRPVHVLYFRTADDGVIEIVRVLHERMEPSLHVGAGEAER